MAIYHCNISVASRADGASAVAGAAYLSRSKLVNERDGLTHDFRFAHQHEELVADLGVSLPDGAPEEWRDRSVLWNEVERVERKADAQLARRIECALPDELSEDEQIKLARAIVADRVADGHVVDACIHRNVNRTNAHLHILEPLRRCDAHGFMAKSENAYTVRVPLDREIWSDETGEEARERAIGDANRKANGKEFKELAEEGYEKVYKYRRGNEWRHLTKTEAGYEENAGFKRQGRNAVQETRYLNNGWNERERAEEWRAAIAEHINDALKAAKKEARVDHRSYARQGIDKVPQMHEGSRVKAIEARAEANARKAGVEYRPVTDRAAENAERRRVNAVLAKAREAYEELGRRIEAMRGRAADGIASEMSAWRERIERARALLFQARQKPSKAVSRHQADVYARQARTRLRGYQERLSDPLYRHLPTGTRDLTKRERAFLTPEQDARYLATRKREVEAERIIAAQRRAEQHQTAQQTRRAPEPQYHVDHQRGMSR